MDRQVGEILARLKADGLSEHTIVMFWGDHGEGLPRGKRWIYDSGIHVPLVVRWPGQIKPGTSRDDLVWFLDFAPPVLSLAGVKPPSHMHGQVILGQHTAGPRGHLFAHRDRIDEAYDLIRAVRDRRFKYIRNLIPGETEELYDMKKDPGEFTNLAMQDKHLGLLRKLRKQAIAELKKTDCAFADKMPPVLKP